MRRRQALWVSGAFGAGLLGALAGNVAFSWADVRAAGFGGWRGHGHHNFRDPESARQHAELAAEMALRWVDASDEQQQRVKTIVAGSLTELLPLGERHRANRQAFLTELARPAIDRPALERIRQEELKLAEEASGRLLKTVADVAEVLTPEQRARLGELAERFHR